MPNDPGARMENLPKQINLAMVLAAAARGQHKLEDLIEPSGKFVYAYNYPSGKPLKRYNILRHYGAVWSILTGRKLNGFVDDYSTENGAFKSRTAVIMDGNEILPKVVRALAWAGRCILALGPEFATDITQAKFVVWHDYVKLGANGLALLAIAEFIEALLENEHNQFSTWRIANYSNWIIIAEQLALGIHELLPENQPPIYKADFPHLDPHDFESEYYLGEALFALAKWKTVCQQLASHNVMVAERSPIELDSYKYYPRIWHIMLDLAQRGYGVEFQSHWMCYAISHEIRHGTYPNYEQLLNYLIILVEDIIARPSYRNRRQSTPIACRSEALLAAAPIFRKYVPQLVASINTTVSENIRRQLEFTMPDGAIIKGGDGRQRRRVQIDYIQHNISAFVAFANYVREQPHVG